MAKRIFYKCVICGSSAVGLETTVMWDRDEQAWTTNHADFDAGGDAWCVDCGDTRLTEVEMS